jgi:hypothetical protein
MLNNLPPVNSWSFQFRLRLLLLLLLLAPWQLQDGYAV